ncbi:MAG: ABC transporter permease subunit [Bacilli bacterium]
MQKNQKKIWRELILVLAGIGFVFVLWWLLSFLISSTLFPGPLETFSELGILLKKESTYLAIGGTITRLLLSFLISFIFAFVLGVIAGFIKAVKTFLNPLVIILRTIPTAALILIMVVLLLPQYSLLIVTFLMMFPIIYEAIVTGIESIDESVMMALKIDAKPYSAQSIFRVIIPMSGPYILLGIIQSVGLGMKVSIMAEVLVGNNRIPGLGIIIKEGYQYAYMSQVFAVSLIAIVLIGLLDLGLRLAKKKIKH